MALFTQDQVSNWFAQNPNATPEFVAQTVQGLGGLDNNQGLAGLIGQHYGTDANTIATNYNTLTAPAPVAAPVVNVAPVNPFDTGVAAWAAANPNATTFQKANAISQNGGLTPEMAAAVAKQYGTNTDVVDSAYQSNQGINSLYQTYLGRAPESQAVVDQYIKQFGSTIDPEDIAAFRTAAMPELQKTNFLSAPAKNEIETFVNSVLTDKTLSFPEQTNKILNRAREVGVTQPQLESVYGKEKVQPFMDTYKTSINNFINTTLAKDSGTTMNEVGILHKAALDNKFNVDELVKYGGLDKKTAQSYFDLYDKGLGNIVAQLNDPKIDDITKTSTVLSLAQKYGTTDAELAKAFGGKYTEKEIAAYLDPVRNVPTGLQKLMDDPNASAADITNFINNAKADPRAAGIFGVGLDKVLAASPELVMRDIQNGTGSLAQNYQTFLDKAKSTPENAAKYAPQIQAVEKMLGTAMFSANEVYGGKPQDYQLQIVSALPAKATEKIPKQLEMAPVVMETRQGEDGPYQIQTGGGVKSKGVNPIGGGSDAEGGAIPVTGYKADKPVTVNGLPVYAEYDTNGKLTGYVADSSYASWQNGKQYISGAFDANGKPTPRTNTSQQAGIKGVAQDVLGAFNDMGIIGQLALMYATGGAGSALASSMGGGALANAAASGLISGALSEVGGGDFGKGFLGGAVGSGVGSLVQGAIPTNITGNTFIDSYLTKAGPSAASSAARTGVMGGNALDAGLYSLLNTGVGMGVNAGTNMLLGETGLDKLGAAQPYATGIASNLLSGAITGKDFDINKAIANTAAQQLLQSGKTAAKVP